MTERIYEEEGTNRFVEVSSAIHKEIVNHAMENDLTMSGAAEQYLGDLFTGSPDTDESDEDSGD